MWLIQVPSKASESTANIKIMIMIELLHFAIYLDKNVASECNTICERMSLPAARLSGGNCAGHPRSAMRAAPATGPL